MLPEAFLILFYLVILLYAIIIHEVAHGVAALFLGDSTAKYAGRLNLNPLNHIDPVGSVLVPLIMLVTTGFRFAFGWAKPVPYNPYNLSNQKWGPSIVALSGPGSNIVIALVFALMAKLIAIPSALKLDIIRNFDDWGNIATAISGSFGAIFYEICVIVVFWNTLLAFFNLIPIPPLDGSKLLFALMRLRVETIVFLEQFGFVLLIGFIILFSGPLGIFLNFVLSSFFRLMI